MLAQNFKSPSDLHVTDKEHGALISVLGMLERGEITDNQFDMGRTWSKCGTMGCLLGWSRHITGRGTEFFPSENIDARPNLRDLFMYVKCEPGYGRTRPWLGYRDKITVEQGATALRSYLTTGKARWAEALAVN